MFASQIPTIRPLIRREIFFEIMLDTYLCLSVILFDFIIV